MRSLAPLRFRLRVSGFWHRLAPSTTLKITPKVPKFESSTRRSNFEAVLNELMRHFRNVSTKLRSFPWLIYRLQKAS